MRETEEHFYLEISEPRRPHIAARYAYLQPVTIFGQKIGLEPLLGPDILYAEAFKLSDVERVRTALQRQIGPAFKVLPISVNDPSLALPAEIRKVIGA